MFNAGILDESSMESELLLTTQKKGISHRYPLFVEHHFLRVLHDGKVNDAMRVLQLKVPLFIRYSLVYQNVQSSTGSMLMLL